MSDERVVKLTRMELYNKIWATPVHQLAKEYGLSDVGLAKVCRRHKIPRPSRGYWAKKQFGKNVGQPPLPAIDDPKLEMIEFTRASASVQEKEDLPADILSRILWEKNPANLIGVPQALRSPHPLVVEAKEVLEEATANEYNVLSQSRGYLNISVTPSCLSRALRIMDGLIKALEIRRHTVSAGGRSTQVMILEEVLHIRLKEKIKQLPHSPTPEERQRKRKEYLYHPPRWDYQPTGQLELQIMSDYGYAASGVVADRLIQPLEERLNLFIIKLLKEAGKRKLKRAVREREERERQERLRQIQEEENRRKEEVARQKALLREVSIWHQSQKLRQYVQAVQDMLAEQRIELPPENLIQKWLEWARRQADQMDPLAKRQKLAQEGKWTWQCPVTWTE